MQWRELVEAIFFNAGTGKCAILINGGSCNGRKWLSHFVQWRNLIEPFCRRGELQLKWLRHFVQWRELIDLFCSIKGTGSESAILINGGNLGLTILFICNKGIWLSLFFQIREPGMSVAILFSEGNWLRHFVQWKKLVPFCSMEETGWAILFNGGNWLSHFVQWKGSGWVILVEGSTGNNCVKFSWNSTSFSERNLIWRFLYFYVCYPTMKHHLSAAHDQQTYELFICNNMYLYLIY